MPSDRRRLPVCPALADYAVLQPQLVSRLRTPIVATFHRSVGVKIKVLVYEAEEGGFWAEVPAIPGCASQGESMDELLRNVQEAIEGCLSIDIAESKPDPKRRVL